MFCLCWGNGLVLCCNLGNAYLHTVVNVIYYIHTRSRFFSFGETEQACLYHYIIATGRFFRDRVKNLLLHKAVASKIENLEKLRFKKIVKLEKQYAITQYVMYSPNIL